MLEAGSQVVLLFLESPVEVGDGVLEVGDGFGGAAAVAAFGQFRGFGYDESFGGKEEYVDGFFDLEAGIVEGVDG